MAGTGFNFTVLVLGSLFCGGISLGISVSGCAGDRKYETSTMQKDSAAIELTPAGDINKGGADHALSDVASTGNMNSPPLYELTENPDALKVPGFADAAFVFPSAPSRVARPVVIVLHGNFDRPEWQCDMWQSVASWYGWVLCPRGVRTPWATVEEDRWTYRGGAKKVYAEMMAALTALESRFPGAVTREGAILVGFSLGAILIPELIQLHPHWFETVFLIEGGLKQLDRHLLSMKQKGVKRIGLAMSTAANRQKTSVLQRKIKKRGIVSVYVDMRGAGHNYRHDFTETGQNALRNLLGETNELTVGNR